MSGWARAGDYLFGRNTLIGVASLMLLVISGYATWHGMRDFIVGVSSAPPGQESGLSISNDVLVAAIVIALTFLMWLALRETFGAQRRVMERLITFPLYLFLAIWSIGFGYGFWWSLIAGEEATRTGLSGLQEDARDAASAVAARLDAVRAQLDNVVAWSESQMAREENSGGSCGTPSGAGQGPLYNARRGVRDGVATLRDGVTRAWVGPVRIELEKLQQSVAGLEGGDVAARQKSFEAKASELRGAARGIAARSNELGKSTAAEMRALAQSVAAAPGEAGFSCYDPTLAQRLRQAADQAGQPAELKLREAAFNEGPAGVANAIKKLWENVGSYLSSLPSYIVSGGDAAGHRTDGGEPISGRDLIALLATIGVDLGLLAMTALNPPAAGPIRRDGLAATQARLRLPTETVIRQLRGAMRTAIARAPGVDFEWVRRHFIHHGGSSYYVIPNLYSVDQKNKDEEEKALAMNQLAGVLDDLKLVRALTPEELQKFGKEEQRNSFSDLTPYRDERRKTGAETTQMPEGAPRPLRNHGLLSKAQRALDIAGWSEDAQRDVEIYRLVDAEGLTPLLAVLNDGAAGNDEAPEEETPPGGAPALAGEKAPLLIESKRDA